MELSNLIYWAVGIIVTIFVAYLGIRYSYKYKARTQLLYFENSCVPLFRKVVKELNGLEITFKGKTVDKNLIVYKGTIYNSGNNDIDKSIIYEPLKIILPCGFEWREVAIIDKSDGLNIKISSDFEKSTFIFDILKESEYFTFDSVIEYKPQLSNEEDSNYAVENITRHLSNNIKFYHRITNLKKVEKGSIPSKPLSYTGIIIISFVFLLLAIGASTIDLIFPKYKVYHEIVIDSSHNYVAFKSNDKTEIELIDTINNKIGTYKTDNSNSNKFTGKLEIRKEYRDLSVILPELICSILFALIGFSTIYFNLKNRDLYKNVKNIADKYDYNDFPERMRSKGHVPDEYLIRKDGKPLI